ncbi:choice-of-anchor D domain-containing protein, partial [bacterium]|nr:choice-of-anchor D domain-containing protein [bacterium]
MTLRRLGVVIAVLAVLVTFASVQGLLAAEANISVTPDTYDFDYGPVGVCGPPVDFTISNDGDATLSVLDVISSDPSVFEVICSTPATVATGATAGALIAFCPGAAQDYVGTVTFVSNDPDGDFVVNVTGTGIPPAISVTPDTYDFDYGPVGVCGAPVDFTIANGGHGDLVVTD